MKTLYRILGVVIGLVVALCGCDVHPNRDYIKEAVRDTFEAGKSAGRFELVMEQMQEKIQAVKTAHEQYEGRYGAEATDISTDTQYGHPLPPPTEDSPKAQFTDYLTSEENTMMQLHDATQDRQWTWPGDFQNIPSGTITEITTKDGVVWWWNRVREEWMEK